MGKTSMLVSYYEGVFDNKMLATQGVDVKQKVVNMHGKNLNVKTWDTAG